MERGLKRIWVHLPPRIETAIHVGIEIEKPMALEIDTEAVEKTVQDFAKQQKSLSVQLYPTRIHQMCPLYMKWAIFACSMLPSF